jgi:hypothetical protein
MVDATGAYEGLLEPVSCAWGGGLLERERMLLELEVGLYQNYWSPGIDDRR